MPDPRPVALLGATGYTGRLVAAELVRREVPCRLGARHPDRLAAVPRGPGAETFVVDLEERRRLLAFLQGASVVVSTVGPFLRMGMAVVEAAVEAGVPYLDISGETAFVDGVYRRFEGAGVPIVPACGFEVVPGDLAAALAAAALDEPVTAVDVRYDLSRVFPSRGTIRTALEMGSAGDAAIERRRATGPGGGGGVSWPGAETITVPRHIQGATVVVSASTSVPMALAAGVGAALARPLAPLLSRLASLLPEGPPPALRSRSQVRVIAEAVGPSGGRTVVCEGADVYALAARFVVEAALVVSSEGYDRRGALAPAQALDPASFLDAVSGGPPERADGARFSYASAEGEGLV